MRPALSDRFGLASSSTRQRKAHRATFRPRLMPLEGRTAPAVASLSAGILTIDFTATGTTAENVGLARLSTYSLSGNVSGSTTFALTDVQGIVIQDSGGSDSQSITLGGSTFALTADFQCTGIEHVTVNAPMNALDANSISIAAPRYVNVLKSMTSNSGDIVISANQQTPLLNGGIGVTITAATISSTSGKIDIYGRSGYGGLGVDITQSSTVGANTTGPVIVTGIAGGDPQFGPLGNQYGVHVRSSTVTSGGGTVTVTGTGGGEGKTGGNNYGIFVDFAGVITAGGDGAVNVTGTGGGLTGSNGGNHGVYVLNNGAKITSSGGPVSVTGYGSLTTGSNRGVLVLGEISAGNNGQVTVIGQAGPNGGGFSNQGVAIDVTGKVFSNGGNVTVEGTGGKGQFDCHGVGLYGTIMSGGNGKVSVTGIGGGGRTDSFRNYGVHLANFGKVASSGGDVFVSGTGGGTVGTGDSVGIYLDSSDIAAGGLGSVTVIGLGGNSGDMNHGIYMTNSAQITSSGGDIVVNATGGNGTDISNHGLFTNGIAEIIAVGKGSITIVGQAGESAVGGKTTNSLGITGGGGRTVSTVDGDISITGIGTSGTGVDLRFSVKSTGSGNISIQGKSSSLLVSAAHVAVSTKNTISANGGNISIYGETDDLTLKVGRTGVAIGSTITAGGAGNIAIVGKAVAVGSNINCAGVYIFANVTTSGGNIDVSGTASSNDSINASIGTRIDATISAGGTGAVSIDGELFGPASSSINYGILLFGTSAKVITANGPIDVMGANAGNGTALAMQNSATIASGGGGDVNIIANSLAFLSFTINTIRAGTASDRTISIVPKTPGTNIDLGGADIVTGGVPTLGLLKTETSQMFAGTVLIGNTDSGAIVVSDSIVRTSKTHITLTSAKSISLAASAMSSNGDITLKSGGPITQTVGFLNTGTGTLTLDGPDQTATLNSLSNQANQVLVTAKTTALVNGAIQGPGNIQVHGILSGNAIVGSVNAAPTGRIRPGVSPGRLTTAGLALMENSIAEYELNGIAPGYDYDQIAVNGLVNLGNATLQAVLGFVPPPGSRYVLIANDGADAVVGTFAGLSEGAMVNLNGVDFAITYHGGDGNDVVLQAPGNAPPTPTVLSTVINNGSAQRSLVIDIKVTFSESVLLLPGAFQVERTGFGTLGAVATDVVQVGSFVTVTFKAGGAVAIDPGNSLADGLYRLTISSDRVLGSSGGKLDGNGNGVEDPGMIDDPTLNFHRLFGDSNGDGAVSAVDFNAFRLVYGSTGPSIFDFDGDNQVSSADFNEFRTRYGVTI